MLHFGKKTPEREEWWAVSDQTGEVFGPFDPGTVWFETPNWIGGSELLRLSRVADLILNEAHAGWERLQRALAFLQPNGLAVYRRFMESGIVPPQTPALGLAGGLDIPAYLGDGAATGSVGFHVDDSYNGTMIDGFDGGGGGHSRDEQGGRPGRGPGGGEGGGGVQGNNGSAGTGSGGGYGTAGAAGSRGSGHYSPIAGPVVSDIGIIDCLKANLFTREVLGHGSGGGGGGSGPHRSFYTEFGGNGGNGGPAHIEIVHGILTTVARTLTGSDGVTRSGSGAGGLAALIGSGIVYGTGTIDVSGGTRARAGGQGRVVQVYFDSKADNLSVTGGVQSQFRILRSVPIGQNTFL